MAPRKKKQKTATAASEKTNNTDEKSSRPSSKFIIILSPAKTLDLNCNLQLDEPIEWSQPGNVSLEKTNGIIKCMKEHAKSTSKLSKLLGVSTKLGETAKSYWDDMNIIDDSDSTQTTTQNYKSIPCAFLFQGPAYQGLDISSLEVNNQQYLQDHLRIVDPLYGWLRPMDAIKPYRLEMNTKNLFGDKVKLTDYWRPAIQSILLPTTKTEGNEADEDGIIIINLASEEYASAVPSDSDEGSKITKIKVVFQTKGRVIGVHAKRARGLFAKFLAQNNIDTLTKFYDSVKDFDMERYTYQSHDSNIVVYDRTTVPKPNTTSKKAAASKK